MGGGFELGVGGFGAKGSLAQVKLILVDLLLEPGRNYIKLQSYEPHEPISCSIRVMGSKESKGGNILVFVEAQKVGHDNMRFDRSCQKFSSSPNLLFW